jgi:hypothetical protein
MVESMIVRRRITIGFFQDLQLERPAIRGKTIENRSENGKGFRNILSFGLNLGKSRKKENRKISKSELNNQ